MLILVVVLLIVVVSCFFIGRRTAKNSNSYLRKHPTLAKVILLAYIVFAGCFVFPISSEPFPIDFMKVYLIVASYGMIGLGFAGLYGVAKEKWVYLITFSLTILGMIFRYVLEYGEVSNNYNFTMLNVVSYIAIIPMFTVIIYHYNLKYLSKKK